MIVEAVIGALFILTMLILSISHSFKHKNMYVPIEKKEIDSDALKLIHIINDHRLKLGLNEVKCEMLTTDLATEHATYMNGLRNANHHYAESRFERSHANNYGEVCTYGYVSAMSIFYAYLKSEDHKEIIESDKYEWVGVATVGSANCCFFTNY